jgi:hypothetical protein
MKRWQSILLQLGFAAAAIFTPAIPNTAVRDSALAAEAAAVAATAHKTSTSNPDGSDARAPWSPK